MAAELNALMPMEGGFYFWVKEALGPFWGFAEAYLTLLYTAVDMAIYPVLFSAYLAFLYPLGTGGAARGRDRAGMARRAAELSRRAAGRQQRDPDDRAIAGAVRGAGRARLRPSRALASAGAAQFSVADCALALGGGLTIMIWNFSGWENASVVAGEIRDPRRTYQRALAIALPMVVLGYMLPLGVALSGAARAAPSGRPDGIQRDRPPARRPGAGRGARARRGWCRRFRSSPAAMLWVSRMPFVLGARELSAAMAGRGLEHHGDSRQDQSWPVACSSRCWCRSASSRWSILDVFFYMGALVLELSALVVMRRKRPARDGLFVIGGGRAGLYLVAGLPMLTWCATFGLALTTGGIKKDFIVAVVLAATTYPAYALCRRIVGRAAARTKRFRPARRTPPRRPATRVERGGRRRNDWSREISTHGSKSLLQPRRPGPAARARGPAR